MKKFKIVFAVLLTIGLLLSQTPAFAANGDEPVDTTNYIKSSDVIKEVQKEGDKVILTVGEEKEDSLITMFFLTKETLMFDSLGEALTLDSFAVGQRIDAYYDKNKPMILIYPAQIYPEIVIVHDEKQMGTVKVGKFDSEFLSLDKELKLNISEETVLLDNLGNKIGVEDLAGKELIVFYTFATKSIPAQTTPTKIMAITVKIDKLQEVNRLIGNDFHLQNNKKMIPLRKVAEYLGFDVKYVEKTQSAELKLGKESIIVHLFDKAYKDNETTAYFEETPYVKNGKTYVSEEFIYVLMNR